MKLKGVGWAVGVSLGACTQVNVVPVAVEEVTVLPTQVTAEVSETAALTVELRSSSGEALSGYPVEWSTTDPSVAAVDSVGTITALAPGQAIIAAEADGQLGTAFVTVVEPVPVGPPPERPTNLNANDQGATVMRLTWDDKSDNEQWFEVQRRIKDGTWSLIATPEPEAEEFFDTGLEPDTEYEYRVRACNLAGCSRYSNRDKDKTDDD